MQEGRNVEDMQKFDYMSFAILPDPGRSEEQRHLRAGSHYSSDYGQTTSAAPAKLIYYAHCEVEPLRTLRLVDDVSDEPIGLCYMGAFLNPRLYLRHRCCQRWRPQDFDFRWRGQHHFGRFRQHRGGALSDPGRQHAQCTATDFGY